MLISKNKSRAPFRLTRVDTLCRGVSALLAILLYNSLLKNTTSFVNLIEKNMIFVNNRSPWRAKHHIVILY